MKGNHMKTMEKALRASLHTLVLLTGIFTLLFAALPARAQLQDGACPRLNDVPEEILNLYLDELEDEFEADFGGDALCSALRKNFVKACQTAVKDALKCIQNQLKTVDKQNQALCKALAGPGLDACANYYKNSSKAAAEVMKTDAGFRAENCEQDAGQDFYDVCFNGF